MGDRGLFFGFILCVGLVLGLGIPASIIILMYGIYLCTYGFYLCGTYENMMQAEIRQAEIRRRGCCSHCDRSEPPAPQPRENLAPDSDGSTQHP